MNISTRRLLTSITREIGGFFVSKKIFSRIFWKRGDFGCAFWPPLSKWVKGLIPNHEKVSPYVKRKLPIRAGEGIYVGKAAAT